MRHHGPDELFPEPAAAVLGQDEDVHEVGVRRAVSNDAGEADLLLTLVGAEAERVVDRAVDDLARDAGAPVRILAEEAVDELAVELRLVR